MRNMSFSATAEQIRNGEKTVTRRLGWANLKPGELIQPCLKCQGLKKGEKVTKLRGPIRIVRVHREPLSDIFKDPSSELTREGFGHIPNYTVYQFCDMFTKMNGCQSQHEITRIEFEYLEAPKETAHA